MTSLLAAISLKGRGRQQVKVPTFVRFMTPGLGGHVHCGAIVAAVQGFLVVRVRLNTRRLNLILSKPAREETTKISTDTARVRTARERSF